MWTPKSEQLARGLLVRITPELGSATLAYADIIRLWQHDQNFRSFFVQLLADAPYRTFRWETPPVSMATANCPFEFVLLDSPGLASHPDASAFAEHFGDGADAGIVEFMNLGKDAILVAPCPRGPDSTYGHLAAFVRCAPQVQQHALWQRVGAAMERRLSTKPVWLSTAGAGVSWLHVRLDDRPKYYGYAPYRDSI